MSANMALVTTLTQPRKSFVSMAGIKSLDDVMKLTKEQLEDICSSKPKAATALIMDLLSERGARSVRS